MLPPQTASIIFAPDLHVHAATNVCLVSHRKQTLDQRGIAASLLPSQPVKRATGARRKNQFGASGAVDERASRRQEDAAERTASI